MEENMNYPLTFKRYFGGILPLLITYNIAAATLGRGGVAIASLAATSATFFCYRLGRTSD